MRPRHSVEWSETLRGLWRIRRWLDARRRRRLTRHATKAIAAFPRQGVRFPHRLAAPLIVTLTSYPPRFPDLARTLASLLDQTIAADRTVLWIAEGDMSELPADVRRLEAHGLELHACADLRSYKKLVPALALWPQSVFVTADDDVYYPSTWLESLIAAHRQNPRTVIAGRGHMAGVNPDGALSSYESWELATASAHATLPNRRFFPTGVGGILYPPGALSPQVTDSAAFLELCPHGDDIWFFWMARLIGTDHHRARDWFDIITWPDTQDVALANENLLGGRNDQQIRAMERRFGPIP